MHHTSWCAPLSHTIPATLLTVVACIVLSRNVTAQSVASNTSQRQRPKLEDGDKSASHLWARGTAVLSLGTGVSVGAGLELDRRVRAGPEILWFSPINFDKDESITLGMLMVSYAAASSERSHLRVGLGAAEHITSDTYARDEVQGLAGAVGYGFTARTRPWAFTMSADVVFIRDKRDSFGGFPMFLLQIGALVH